MSATPVFTNPRDPNRFYDKAVALLPHTFTHQPQVAGPPWEHNVPGSALHRSSYTIGAFWHNTNRNSHRAGYGVLEFFVYDQLMPVSDPAQLTYAQALQLPAFAEVSHAPGGMPSVNVWLRTMVGFYSAYKLGGTRGYDNPEMLKRGGLQPSDFGTSKAAIDQTLNDMLASPIYLPPYSDGWYLLRS